jgi:hypothetical protein
MAPVPGGGGYWIFASDGGVFTFGDAPYVGSVPGLGKSVVNIVGALATADGHGYSVVGSDGTVFGFGDGVSSVPASLLSGIVGSAAT